MRRNVRAFTLVEVMIATFIVIVTGLAIIAGVIYGLQSQQAIRERNGALRAAADTLETTKRALFVTLTPNATSTVVIDDRGTAAVDDDITGQMTLKYYDTSGNLLNTIPLDRSMIVAEATVTWNPAGRRSTDAQTITLRSLLAP